MNTQSLSSLGGTEDLMNEIDQLLPESSPDNGRLQTAEDIRLLLDEIDDSLPVIGATQQDVRDAVSDIDVDIGAIGDLLGEIDSGLSDTEKQIQSLSLENKRAEATDSKESFVLGVLAMDPNPVIRTLVCCNAFAPGNALRKLATKGTDHMRVAIAHNAGTPSDVLDRIVDLTDEREVLQAVHQHPKATPITRHRVETILESSNSGSRAIPIPSL